MLLHELWIENSGKEQSFLIAGPMGAAARELLSKDAHLKWSCWAKSHYDAMTQYYNYMAWGPYSTDYPNQDKAEYSKEWVNMQRDAGISPPEAEQGNSADGFAAADS